MTAPHQPPAQPPGQSGLPGESRPAPAPVPAAVPLLEPRDGLPPLVETAAALDEAIRALGAGQGPVAVDAERASGFRYGHRAFLVQLRRQGTGTVLIDPVACPDLSALDVALAGTEAVLHAASQDLPCLADLGYRPKALFDTELAGRLLGYPRVGLGPLVETVLGLSLEKGHAAADWSTRPLPEDWLRYAALDVEVLVDLRDALAGQLVEQDKDEWARQEFSAVLNAGPPAPGPTHGGAPRASTACAPGAAWPSSASCGWNGTGSRSAATCPRAGCCPTRPSSRRPGRRRSPWPS